MIRIDEQIKRDIVDNLLWNDSVDASDVGIEVNNGTVTLNGTVPNYAALVSAISEIWNVDGVIKINNLIQVKYPEKNKVPSDSDIQIRAENILAWNPDLESSNIQLFVENGVVTLKGSVDTFWKKLKAKSVVTDLKGILLVDNQLVVTPSDRTIDQSIAAYIMEVLNRKLDIDTSAITVTVLDGKVVLTGIVPSKHAYQDVYNAAKFTLGVTDVVNSLQIKSAC